MRLTRAQLLLPLTICLLCQAMYRAFSVTALAYTAREAFFGGLCAAMAMAVLVLIFVWMGDFLSASGTSCICKNVVRSLVGFFLFFGIGQTVLWQLRFYQQIFGAGGFWVLLLCMAGVCLHCTPHALVRCARLLVAFCVVAAICALLGLLGQSDLHRLARESLTAEGFSTAFWAQFCLVPNYLLLLACPAGGTGENGGEPNRNNTIKGGDSGKKIGNSAKYLLLPLLTFGVQFAAVLFAELLFGVQQAGVGGFEFLRSWALLNLSRYDGIVALLWLLLAFFRLRVFSFVALQCYPFARVAQQMTRGEGAIE